MDGWPILIVVTLIMAVVVVWLFGAMVQSIRGERRRAGLQRIWRNFGLSIAFSVLFLVSWLGHGLAQWQEFRGHKQEHGQPAEVRDFMSEFAASTLENWQSEFLQLFSFVVMAALLIHHGSAESRDSEDRIEQALRRIEEKLDGRRPARGRR